MATETSTFRVLDLVGQEDDRLNTEKELKSVRLEHVDELRHVKTNLGAKLCLNLG